MPTKRHLFCAVSSCTKLWPIIGSGFLFDPFNQLLVAHFYTMKDSKSVPERKKIRTESSRPSSKPAMVQLDVVSELGPLVSMLEIN